MHTKRFIAFLKIWVQFRVVAIPRLPYIIYSKRDSINKKASIRLYKTCKIISYKKGRNANRDINIICRYNIKYKCLKRL